MRHLPCGTLTLLFSDIEGSTLMLNRLGERWGEALSAQRAILRAVFESYDGAEMGTEGDSFFVVFTSARQVVRAAVEGQARLPCPTWWCSCSTPPTGRPLSARAACGTSPGPHD